MLIPDCKYSPVPQNMVGRSSSLFHGQSIMGNVQKPSGYHVHQESGLCVARKRKISSGTFSISEQADDLKQAMNACNQRISKPIRMQCCTYTYRLTLNTTLLPGPISVLVESYAAKTNIEATFDMPLGCPDYGEARSW